MVIIGIIAWVFFIIVYIILKPLSFIYNLVTDYKRFGGYLYSSGVNIDKFICYDCRSFLDFLFLTKHSQTLFGKFDDTISYILGMNQNSKTLNLFGWLWVYILWIFVPLKMRGKWTIYYLKIGHCQWAVQSKI